MPTTEPKKKREPRVLAAIRENLSAHDEERPREQQLPNTLERDDVRQRTQMDRNARLVAMETIKPDPDQARKTHDEEADERLKESLDQHGLIHPLTLHWLANKGYFEIIAGERRFRAARALGWKWISAYVRDVSDQLKAVLQLAENVHRRDLNPIEEARAVKHLLDEQKATQDQIARHVRKSRVWVTESLSILENLSPEELAEFDRRPADIPTKSLILAAFRAPDEKTRAAMLHGEFTRAEARATLKRARKRKVGGRPKKFATHWKHDESAGVVEVRHRKANASRVEIGRLLMNAYRENERQGG